MTHEEQLEELRTHISNRLAQVKRAEAQIQELEDRLFELSGIARQAQASMPLASLAGISFSREERFNNLEARVAVLEARTFWQFFSTWVKQLWQS